MERVKKPLKNQTQNNLIASFRDPSGFVFKQKGVVYRQINKIYKSDYENLMNSGLYRDLVASHSLIEHKEVELPTHKENDGAWKVIRPREIPFISYYYEWPFSMLKDAARFVISGETAETVVKFASVSAFASSYVRDWVDPAAPLIPPVLCAPGITVKIFEPKD